MKDRGKMKGKIIVQCGIQIEDEYWFAAGNTNGLFKKNLATGELNFIGFFPNEEKTQFRAYTDVKLVDNKLIFTPCWAKSIAIYDLTRQKFSDVALPDYERGINQYINSVQYKGCVYFIPFSSSSFIKYDVAEGKIKKLGKWIDLKNQYLMKDAGSLIIESVCADNNKIYMFMSIGNQVIILNMDTDQFSVDNLSISSDEKMCSAYQLDHVIWIATDKNKIYQWEYVDNEILQTFDLNKYINETDYYIHYIYATDKYVYLINEWDKNIRVLDYINNKFSVIDTSGCVSDKKDDCISLYYYYDIRRNTDHKINLFSFYDGKYITIEGEHVLDSVGEFALPEEYLRECFSDKFFDEGRTLRYLAFSFFEEIEEMLAQNTPKNAYGKHYEKNIGSIIYETVMKA